MNINTYQRTVFAYHGCDRRVRDSVLLGKMKLLASLNTYDWLGQGIYFWEHGPRRALEWAGQQAKRKNSKIQAPAVLGAVIHLGNCFDLLDLEFTELFSNAAQHLSNTLNQQGIQLPQNQNAGTHDFDWLRRERDCFVLNSTIPEIELTNGLEYHSVRGVFQEGRPAFHGAGIKYKSHIQIAVRNPQAIIGYFNPEIG
jgi:hypothetical protein